MKSEKHKPWLEVKAKGSTEENRDGQTKQKSESQKDF